MCRVTSADAGRAMRKPVMTTEQASVTATRKYRRVMRKPEQVKLGWDSEIRMGQSTISLQYRWIADPSREISLIIMSDGLTSPPPFRLAAVLRQAIESVADPVLRPEPFRRGR